MFWGWGKGQQRVLHSSYILPTQTKAWICVPDSHTLGVVKFLLLMPKVTQNFSSLTKFIYKAPEVYIQYPLLMDCLNGKIERACFVLE